MNAVLGHLKQDALIAPEEVAPLLSSSAARTWSAASAEAREAAIRAVGDDVRACRWSGEPLFHDQPLPLPTLATWRWQGTVTFPRFFTASAGSTERRIELVTLAHAASFLSNWVGGSAIVIERDESYRQAVPVVAADMARCSLLLADGLTVPLANKAILLIGPLHLPIRRAFALQAFYHLNGRQEPVVDDPRTVWGAIGYALLRPYLEKESR